MHICVHVARWRGPVVHSDPHRIEDTFYMALTYMNEPKQASVLRIAKYLAKYYGEHDNDKYVQGTQSVAIHNNTNNALCNTVNM